MAIIALKAWYLQDYEPIKSLENRPHDLRLAKNSLLKSALRADFLEDIDDVKQADWFQRYQYEIPVLCRVVPLSEALPDSASEQPGQLVEQPLPRLSPRAPVAQLERMLQTYPGPFEAK